MFNSECLKFARKRRGLTKKSLAERAKLSPRSISMFENNEASPSEETLYELSKKLDFPVEFFLQDETFDALNENAVSFRSLSKMSAGRKYSALNAGAIAIKFNEWVNERFSLPSPDLIETEGPKDPEIVAMTLREYWGVGELSIGNLIHLLEAKGIRVFSLAEDTVDVDAFSLWKDNTPYIFLNTLKSAERSRFDAAHELGHLILHRHGAPSGTDAEKEADQFASAFLMPESSIRSNISSLETIGSLIEAKRNWRVSLSALAYRTHKLGIISDWHYRTLCIEISKNGFNKQEPNGIQREQSKIGNIVFDELRKDFKCGRVNHLG